MPVEVGNCSRREESPTEGGLLTVASDVLSWVTRCCPDEPDGAPLLLMVKSMRLEMMVVGYRGAEVLSKRQMVVKWLEEMMRNAKRNVQRRAKLRISGLGEENMMHPILDAVRCKFEPSK